MTRSAEKVDDTLELGDIAHAQPCEGVRITGHREHALNLDLNTHPLACSPAS